MTNKEKASYDKGYSMGFNTAKKLSLHQYKKELIEKIKIEKDFTRQQTGAFKYDDCYDEIIKIINTYEV